MLQQLIYISRAKRHFPEAALLDLLKQSRLDNERTAITGLLLYHDGKFIQLLEGSQPFVDALYARITRDRRHGGCLRLHYHAAQDRLFAHWFMAFRPHDQLPQADQAAITHLLASANAGNAATKPTAIRLMERFARGMARESVPSNAAQ